MFYLCLYISAILLFFKLIFFLTCLNEYFNLLNSLFQCVARYGRKEELLSPTPLLLRSAAVMVKLHCKAEEKEDLGKAEKFIRKVSRSFGKGSQLLSGGLNFFLCVKS